MHAEDIPGANRLLKEAYSRNEAPIIELIKHQTQDPFRILVATLLSARTKDETTAEVCRRLFKVAGTPQALAALSEDAIAKLIYPVGFYKTKARHLAQLPAALQDRFEGRIPQNIDDLCTLPGVGRKTANLVMIAAFDKHGMCVDTHVHRISNRLGLISTDSPHASEIALRKVLPKRYWKTWNRYLVSLGQTVCRPIHPRCSVCTLYSLCERRDVERSR